MNPRPLRILNSRRRRRRRRVASQLVVRLVRLVTSCFFGLHCIRLDFAAAASSRHLFTVVFTLRFLVFFFHRQQSACIVCRCP